jgi:SAM-dependent methyltransferase
MQAQPLDAPFTYSTLLETQSHLIAALEAGNREAIWQHTAALCREIVDLERDQVPRSEIVSALEPARRVHGESPFVHRLQAWPRGYPGDFETIEYLVGGTNQAPRGTRAWWVEQVALSSPIAVQHRCKVRRQAEEIRRVCASTPDARVLVLACGGGRDLQVLIDEAERLDGAHLVLVDQDLDAVSLATDRGRLLGATVTPLAVDVLRGLRRAEGPFHLILAGGLFDYLTDQTIVLVLKLARRKLAEGGAVLFTNIAEGNPYRPWIEYLGDWHLLERTRQRVMALAAEAGLTRVQVEPDGTALSLVAHAWVEELATLPPSRRVALRA